MAIKDTIRDYLENKEFDRLVELAMNEKSTIKYLISFLYSEDDLLRWRAADALGIIGEHPEAITTQKLTVVLDRLFMNLDDRSGGNAWGAMEAIGAIIAARPRELGSFVPKMFTYIADGRVRKGLLWSVHKIGQKRPELFEDLLVHIVGLLRNPNNSIRGHAAWALGAIGSADAHVVDAIVVDTKATLEALQSDNRVTRVYDAGELREVTVGDLAKEALAAISSRTT